MYSVVFFPSLCALLTGLSVCPGDFVCAECEPLLPSALVPASVSIPAYPYRRLSEGRPTAMDPSGIALHW